MKKPDNKTSADKNNKKFPARLFLLLPLILLVLLLFFCHPYLITPKLQPEQLAATAITDLLSAESFSFTTRTELTLTGNSNPANTDNTADTTTVLGTIDGEFSGEDFHVHGKMLGTPVDIYQLSDTTWRKDTITEQWLQTDDGRLLSDTVLLNEVDPRAALRLTAMTDITESEPCDINGEKCRTVIINPHTESGYYEKYFDNLTYTLKISADNKLKELQINATVSSGTIESRLSVICQFRDINATPPITPPAFN